MSKKTKNHPNNRIKSQQLDNGNGSPVAKKASSAEKNESAARENQTAVAENKPQPTEQEALSTDTGFTPTFEEIQVRAYIIHEQKGGSELDNWLEAEYILKQEHRERSVLSPIVGLDIHPQPEPAGKD